MWNCTVSPFYNCPISFCKCYTVPWGKSKAKRMRSSSFKKSIQLYLFFKSIGPYIWQCLRAYIVCLRVTNPTLLFLPPPLSCQALLFETYPTPHIKHQTPSSKNFLVNPLSKPFSLTALSSSQSTLR